VLLLACCGQDPPVVEGEQRAWSYLTLSFSGPEARETDDEPNPFLDYRLQVKFTGPSGKQYDVPGFFDGDGLGGAAGNVWRVRFTPDEAGEWAYTASFRAGPEVAVSLEPDAGAPAAFDGASGSLTIAPRDPEAPGFAKWGRLEYAGGHYLKFREGPHWIRGGTDSPENLLAYEGFDDTAPSHRYQAHLADWHTGDPDWGEGRGRAIIGALNYLASRHVNSIYFLTNNVGGDGNDVWPWVNVTTPTGSPDNDNLHYDVSLLRQWEAVFAHAQRLGIFLHFVFNEAEEANKKELDDGELGPERKLYYRELVARFGHHLALEWNLCEEYNIRYDLGHDRVREFARYVQAVDPYHHPITVHSAREPLAALSFTFGDPLFSLTSIQINQRRIDAIVEAFRKATAEAGRPLPISIDEFTLAAGQERTSIPVDIPDRHRREKLWPTYLSGGMIEFILEGLLQMESFKTPQKDALWNYVWFARKFVEEFPFHEMNPADELVSGEATIEVIGFEGEPYNLDAQVLAKPGEAYAIYLPKGSPSGAIDLSGVEGPFEMRWYNPRNGEYEGEPRKIEAGGRVPFGAPPGEPNEDWAIRITAQ
jgi:hypothetical protein